MAYQVYPDWKAFMPSSGDEFTVPSPSIAKDYMDEFHNSFNKMMGVGIYVVKGVEGPNKGGYMRIPTLAGPAIWVRSVRLATRLDSKLWALTLAGHFPGTKAVRLKLKQSQAKG